MRKPRDAFREVDRLQPSDELWHNAQERASADSPAEVEPRLDSVPAWRRIAVIVTTLGLVVVVGGALLREAVPQRDGEGSVQNPDVQLDPLRDLPYGWTELPSPPDVRSGAVTAWTGSHLIVWGGYVYTGYGNERPLNDGYILDPVSGERESIAPSPLDPRAFPAWAWTGEELLVWGGWDLVNGFFADGASYSPASREWTLLSDARLSARAPLFAWTGHELIVWGSNLRKGTAGPEGAAYDPSTRTWRALAQAPLNLTEASVVWTGQQVVMLGAELDADNAPSTNVAVGATYDPVANRWKLLPDSELSPQASSIAWNGQEIVAWDYRGRAQRMLSAEGEWSRPIDVPIQPGECVPNSINVAGVILGEYCGEFILFRENAWEREGPPLRGSIVSLIEADETALIASQDLESGETSLLAFRPRQS